MRIIDCYYIKGNGSDSKCYKIHGAGIAYNVAKGLIYAKGIGVVSLLTSLPPIGVVIGVGVGSGFVNVAINMIKNGVV